MTPVGTPVRTATVHTPCWPAHHLSPHTWLALHPCFFILFVLRLKCFPLPYKTRLLPFFKQDFFMISPVKSFYFYSFVCGNLYLYTFWAHFPPESRAGNYTNMCVYTVLMAVSRILTHTNYLVTQCFVKHITKGNLFLVLKLPRLCLWTISVIIKRPYQAPIENLKFEHRSVFILERMWARMM